MKTFFVFLLTFAAGFWFFTSESSQKGPEFSISYSKALSKAEREKKPLVVIFSSTRCQPCVRMKEEVYPSEEVQTLHDRFVWAYLDLDDPANQRAAIKYRVWHFPSIFVLDSQGRIISESGSDSPEGFASFLRAALLKMKK